jgi:hypothetical protein
MESVKHKRVFRHASQEVITTRDLSGLTKIKCDYPVDESAYEQETPTCTGCFGTQCSRFHGKRGSKGMHEMYWIKCEKCSKWRDVSNSEQRVIVADERLILPHGHECGCQDCQSWQDSAVTHKPDLKGPVPCEIVEKAFDDTLGVLLEEYSLRNKLKEGNCTQAELDAAITRTRKFFVSRVQSYGDGLYMTSIITKQVRSFRSKPTLFCETVNCTLVPSTKGLVGVGIQG